MSRLKAANNAQTTLAALMEAGADSCTVANGDILPAAPFMLSVDSEIMEVGAKSGNDLSSILRGQEGTTAAAHQSGSIVEAKMTAGMYNELLGPGEGESVKNNYSATVNPTVNDDSGDGYSVGSTWINIMDDKAYVCLDATAGAAKWELVSGLANHLAETAPHSEATTKTITVGAGKDFTTWQAAIDSLKKRIDSTITIQGDAGTYSENITVKGFYGSGELNILGDTVVSSDYVIETISIEKCSLPVKVKGLCSSTAAGIAFQVDSCQRVLFDVCRSIVSGAGYGFSIEASMTQVNACDISNRTIAIAAGVEATVASASCTGSGNTYGLYCNGAATIGKNGTQAEATTAEYSDGGGVIR